MVEWVISKCPEENKKYNWNDALCFACENGSLDIVEFLYQKGEETKWNEKGKIIWDSILVRKISFFLFLNYLIFFFSNKISSSVHQLGLVMLKY